MKRRKDLLIVMDEIKFDNKHLKHSLKDGVEYIQFNRLLEFPELNHAYILKTNNMNFRMRKNFRNLEMVKDNLKKVSDTIGFDYENILRPDYNHTNNIGIYKDEEISLTGESFKNTDGIITDKNNIVLMSTNADCNLILIYDPVKKVFGNIHAGWRGTFSKIAKNAIVKMKEEYNCNPSDIICCFCPSIRNCHFEVDVDVANECFEIFGKYEEINEIIKKGQIKEGKQKYYIDTVLINKILLKSEGIIDSNIIDSNICSVCSSEKVHSKRAEGEDFELSCALIEMKK